MKNKISLSEKRKLERRLPLWESSYETSKPSEQKELLIKIENAREILGMPKFIQNKIKKVDREVEKEIEVPEVNGNELTPELIVYLHNEKKMKDKQIYDKFGISQSRFFQIKKKNIGTLYYPKKNNQYSRNPVLKIPPQEFLEMKNSGIKNYRIAKNMGTNHQSVDYFEKKYLNKIYKFDLLDEYNENKFKILEYMVFLLNKGIKLNEMNVENLTYRQKCKLKQKYVYVEYSLKEFNFLPIEEYCEFANKGMKDKDIAPLIGMTVTQLKNLKKNHVRVKYFSK